MILSTIATTFVAFTVLFLLACILFGESLVVTLKMDDCRPLLVPVFMFFMVVSVNIAVLLSLIFFK